MHNFIVIFGRMPNVLSIVLSKTQFMSYRRCAKSFWVGIHENAGAVPSASPFDLLLMRNGIEVERVAAGWLRRTLTNSSLMFQRTFASSGFEARADCVATNADGTIDLIEIKSSTDHRPHVADAAFQAIVAERSGVRVGRVSIVHVRADYRRTGEIDPEQLLTIVDVTQEVRAIMPELAREMDDALEFIALEEIDERACTCRHCGSRSRHCRHFARFNPDIGDPSAHDLPRISPSRLVVLDSDGRLDPRLMTETDVTPAQLPILRAFQTARPIIDLAGIEDFLDGLRYPLAFYDYETWASAIPPSDGYRPHAPIPVQYSLHVLHEDGRLDHHEHLSDGHGQHRELISRLAQTLPETGSALVWNRSFEAGCNRRLAELEPEFAGFLSQLDARTMDLMDPFRRHYVHPDFRGSTSIKKVLPALVPELSYQELAVTDGAEAMLAWLAMTQAGGDRKHVLRRQLLDYCRLDTLAMVEILRVLLRLRTRPTP